MIYILHMFWLDKPHFLPEYISIFWLDESQFHFVFEYTVEIP